MPFCRRSIQYNNVCYVIAGAVTCCLEAVVTGATDFGGLEHVLSNTMQCK